MLGFLLIIVICIYFYNTNKKITELEKENAKLKKQLKNFLNSSDSIEKEVVTEQIVTNASENDVKLKEEVKIIQRQKSEKEERERKNTNILVTGAFLIVLAAIVFLMSTWYAISNIAKAGVLVLLVGVFLGASKIAKDKFKLEKTSNTFFYIAMAYIPICLIAFSVLGLFGWYFSIFGEGRYTYLAIAMTLNSLIYYFTYQDRKENGLFYGSILSQIFAIILFGLIFGNNILFISSILLIYNIFLILLTNKDTGLDLLKYFYVGIPYTAEIIALFNYYEPTIYMIILLTLLAINFFLLYLNKSKNLANAYLSNISLYSIGLYYTAIYAENMNSNLKIIITIAYIFTVLLLEEYIVAKSKDNNLAKSSMIISLISTTLLYFWSFELQYSLDSKFIIRPYVVSFIETILMLFSFVKSKELGRKVLGYLIPISLVTTVYNILEVVDASYHFYIISALMIFIIGELIIWEDFKPLNIGFLVISNIVLALTYIFCSCFIREFYNDVIYLILLEVVYVYSYIKNKKYIVFKYLAYFNSNFVLLTCANFIEVSPHIKLLIPVIVSCGIVFIESKYKYLKDEFSDVFSIALQIAAYSSILFWGEMQSVLVSLLYSGYLIYDNLKYKKIQYFRIIPLIGFLITILSSNIEREYLTLIMLLSTIALSFMTIYKKQVSLDTVFSGIYLLFAMESFDNDYIKEILLLIWSIAHLYFVENKYAKDIFKGISYIGALLLYESFVTDLNLLVYTSFEIIGVVIFAIAILKNIINKYIKNADTIEYIVYILLNLWAITAYVDEKDGMIFVLFLVCLLIFSYVKKYGVLFVVSLLTIIGNAILLTREFWFNVPWWIYLLLIGSVLIAFAIKNESDEKKQHMGVGNIIKNIKEKVEK